MGLRTRTGVFLSHGIWQPSSSVPEEKLVRELEDVIPASMPPVDADGLLIVYAETTYPGGTIPTVSIAGQMDSTLKESIDELLSRSTGGEREIARIGSDQGERLLLDGLFIPANLLITWAKSREAAVPFLASTLILNARRQQVWQDRLTKVNFSRLRRWILKSFGEEVEQEEKKDKTRGPAEEFRKAVEACLDMVPQDCPALIAEMERFQHEFRVALAERLEPVLNAYVRQLPQDTYEDKKALARFVNAQLSPLGLAVRCPKTGMPSIIEADANDASGKVSRFRYFARRPEGRRVRTVSNKELPVLELMEDTPRGEGLVNWADKVQVRGESNSQGESP